MNSKKIFITWLTIVLSALLLVGFIVYEIDPYFHYHAPKIDKYYYHLNNERSQNDGIVKHFDYDAMITGTSMVENFKTTQMDKLFNTHSIKVPFSGGSFKEVNNIINKGLDNNPNIKIVLRCLDMSHFLEGKDNMRYDLGEYPDYLYDVNILNDVNYIFNKTVLYATATSIIDAINGEKGIDSFNDYYAWQDESTFGRLEFLPKDYQIKRPLNTKGLSNEEILKIKENIEENVVATIKKYPNVDFYYYISPYSVSWWGSIINGGEFEKRMDAEKMIIEMLLPYENLHLYSFNNLTEITTNLNFYCDYAHYGEWVNDYILDAIKNNNFRLTKDNYLDYLNKEKEFYINFDYDSLNTQIDYEDDAYASEVIKNIK